MSNNKSKPIELYSIGITTGAFTGKELAIYEPSFIIHDLREVVSII